MGTTSAHNPAPFAAFPLAVFGVENDGIGMVLNLLIIFLVALDIALIFWVWNDSRRRLTDPVLTGSAALAALIFPFAGALVYMIVRPPETLEDAYERDLDIRAAELRVRLLEQAVKGGTSSSAQKAALAGELTGEPPVRRGTEPSPRRSADPAQRKSADPAQRKSADSAMAGPQSPGGARRAEATNPTAAQRSSARSSAEKAPTRPSQASQRPVEGRPPATGADGA